jgi:hypothetical protein
VATLAISIVLPPTGELETTGDGTSPTQAQMEEEMEARRNFIDTVSPYLKSLPERPPHRAGNVSRVELLGRDVWSQLNRYLLLVTVDIGDPGIEQELSAFLTAGNSGIEPGRFRLAAGVARASVEIAGNNPVGGFCGVAVGPATGRGPAALCPTGAAR